MLQAKFRTLEDLIRAHVILGERSPKGYETVKCAYCNDYKVRGGFNFDGEVVNYHCFNCSTHARYDPSENRHFISKKMRDILIAFGIPDEEITKTISLNFFKNKEETVKIDKPGEKELSLPYKEVPLPKKSVLVSSNESPWCEVAKVYLESRALPVDSYQFYVSDDPHYEGRLIIPYFFRNKIIYWQGRSLDGSIEPRYKNPSVEKDNIFFNMDEVYRYTSDPLYVAEGPIDSISIGQNSVALLGSTLTEFKIKALKDAAKRRKVIFILDKNRNGYKLCENVLKEGEGIQWYVTSFPDNIEDANDARKKLGKLWIASHLSTSAVKGFNAKLLLNMIKHIWN